MIKKLLPVFVIVLALVCTFVCANAQSPVCTNIQYLDAEGKTITSYTEGAVYATAKIENNTEDAIKPVLVVSGYKDGVMNGIWYKSAKEEISVGGKGEVVVEFTPVEVGEGTVIKATLLDGLKSLNPYLKSAQMLNDTTDLKGILVDGVWLENYSNEETSYIVKTENGDISPVVTDSGTVAEYIAPEAIPGYGNIKVTSAFGNERNIELLMYSKEEQLYSLKGLKYTVGDDEYVLDWFDPDITEYEIELDDNTFYVTVNPEALMPDAEVRVKVQDIDYIKKTFGGVSYFNGSAHTLYTGTTFVTRNAIDNLIPIKNEATNAIIEVEYEGNIRTYTITFISKQPRLVEFNLNEDVLSESYKPSFMGGAAVNNDNATSLSSDRAWAVTNVSDNLIGASMFVLPYATNRGDSTWWQTHNSGEYFNFTADTPGTIYMIGSTAWIEGNLNPEYAQNGWTLIQNTQPSNYNKKDHFAGLSTAFNDYGDYTLVNMVEYQSADQRYNNPDSYLVSSVLAMATNAEVYSKTFEAGENVGVYAVGNSVTTYPNMRSNALYFIVWDLEE